MRKMNGWRRLWILACAMAALWFLLIWPLRMYNAGAVARDSYHRSLMKDMSSGACQSYMELPLAKLIKPPYEPEGGSCWFIYTTREIHKIDDLPFTVAKAERRDTFERLRSAGEVWLVGLIGFICISGGLYLVGYLVAWVRRGFTNS